MIDGVVGQLPVPAGLPADLVVPFVLLDLVLILAMARLVGGLFVRTGQPRVVGEIVAGVLLGPTILGATLFTWGGAPAFLHCDEALAPTGAAPSVTTCLFPPPARTVLGVIGQLALALFMFLVGLELDHRLLKGRLRSITTVSIGVVGIPMIAGALITPVLYNAKFVGGFGTDAQPSRTAFALMVGAMLSVTAFPVMARILQERGFAQSPMGSLGISAAAMTSVLMFLALATAAAVAGGGSGGAIGGKYALVALYLLAMLAVVRPLLAPFGRRFEEAGELSSSMFAGLMLLVLTSAYVADRLGLTVIVGGFLAGAILPARDALFEAVSNRLSDVTIAVLLPVFLAFSGLQSDFTKLGAGYLAGIGLFLLAGIVGKWAGGALMARSSGLNWTESNLLGVLMNCRGLLVLVVALIALNTGVITPQMQIGAVLMALVTTMMTGPLFDRFVRRLPAADAVAPAAPVGIA